MAFLLPLNVSSLFTRQICTSLSSECFAVPYVSDFSILLSVYAFVLFTAATLFTTRCRYPSFAVSGTLKVKLFLSPLKVRLSIATEEPVPSLFSVIFKEGALPSKLKPVIVLPASPRSKGIAPLRALFVLYILFLLTPVIYGTLFTDVFVLFAE